ncbi:chromosome segregation ATPase [Verrucomicrobiota bacterium]|nr:chromosome segregation ATPase [Verrucomicrobiota bacterium]
MTIFFGILAAVFLALFLIWFIKSERLERLVKQRDSEIAAVRLELDAARAEMKNLVYQQKANSEQTRLRYESELAKLQREAQEGLAEAKTLVYQQMAEVRRESDQTRLHYEAEARRVYGEAMASLAEKAQQLESLRRFEPLAKEEEEIRQTLAEALNVATALRAEAEALVANVRNTADGQRKEAIERAQEIRRHAETLLNQATRDAGRIVAEASQRAEQIGGDAYIALRDKELLEQAVKAIRNVIEGYGDRYIIPTRSLLDELAADFGHTEAGQALAGAREHSRRMVEQGQSAACDYAEESRRTTAIRFVVDAFNGRVDAILSRAKYDNCGTLEQEIRDAFSLVNLNGKAFREARVLPTYLDARLAELKWAVVAQELRLKEREEQRALKERIREEEKARREYEKAMQEAQREEELIKEAMQRVQAEAQRASAQDRAKFEGQIALLTQQLTEAEAKNQRALSMAQQTRAGHVYIISNVGAFGDDVFKIGLTRRLEPLDRVKELGDASVPFEFDVHALIRSDDAPSLENLLHQEFDDMRINKVNFRKEFFRVPLNRIRELVLSKGLEASFTMLAEAREYRETHAIERMTPEERQRYYNRHAGEDVGGE